MAITLRYQVPADQLAAISQATGQGQYQQAQDRLALEQEALNQRASQFQQELALRQNLAALQNQQQNRNLGAQMYQFDAQRQDRAALAEMDIAARFQQELMRQQGFADMREHETEQQQAEQQFRLSQEQSRIKQHYQDQQFNSALAAAKQIEEAKPKMSPAMYEQALGQWDQRYGDVAGAYPFVGGQQAKGPDVEELEAIRASLQSGLGPFYYAGMENDIKDMDGPTRATYMAELYKNSSAVQQKKLEAENQVQTEQVKADQKLQIDWQNHEQKLLIDAEKAEQEKIKAQRDMIMDAIAAATKPVSSGIPGEAPKAPTDTEAERQVQQIMKMWEKFGVGPGVGGPTQPAEPTAAYDSIQDATKKSKPGDVFTVSGVTIRRTGPGPADFEAVE